VCDLLSLWGLVHCFGIHCTYRCQSKSNGDDIIALKGPKNWFEGKAQAMSGFNFLPFIFLKCMDPSDPPPLFSLWDIYSVLCLTITLQKATAIYVDVVEWFQHMTWPNHTTHGYILRNIFFSCRETFPSIFEKSHIMNPQTCTVSISNIKDNQNSFNFFSTFHSIWQQLPSVRYTQISVLKAGTCIRVELKLSKISHLPFYVLKSQLYRHGLYHVPL
jgi:hypothetical protein